MLHHQYKVKVNNIIDTFISIGNKYECQLMCVDQNIISSNIRRVPNGPWSGELRQKV